MKALFFFTLLLGLVLQALAQDRVVLLRDTTRLGISLNDLEKAYPPALARKVGERGIFARQGQLFNDSLFAFNRRFIQFIETNKRRLPVPGLIVQTREFIRSDGTFDRVLCTFSGYDLNSEQEV